MGKTSSVIKFTASINKVQTMVDGGLRVVLDFDEINIPAATALMQVKRDGGVIEVAAIPVEIDKVKKWRDPQD